MRKLILTVIVFSISVFNNIEVHAQIAKDGKLMLDNTGEHYIRFCFFSQFWLRSATYNPGSTLFGDSKLSGTDVGIRRFRVQLFGQLSERVFFFSQFGINNYSSVSDRKQGFFVHDVCGEYAIDKKRFSVGIGLSGWTGFARFSSPSVASIMGLDAPLFQQATNDVTDQFLRKLGIYAKGKFGRFDYRVMAAQPISIQKSSYNAPITSISSFSTKPPNIQYNGYFQYQLKDIESNLTPYTTGTYLGKKSVFNLGAGIVYQKDANWHFADNLNDTISTNLLLLGVDAYFDQPLNNNGSALSLYLNYSNTNFGNNYTRNLGVMNPINGDSDKNVINGGGVAFPAIGTGDVLYFQGGYKFRDSLIGNSTLMPYFAIQSSKYEGLPSTMNYYSTGITFLQNGHKSKMTIAYENRPVYKYNTTADVIRKGNFVIQYQISF